MARRTHHMENESNPPIEINRSKKYAAPLGFILFTMGLLATGVLAYAELHAAVNNNASELSKQDIRLDRLEALQAEVISIKKDVEWMRRYMERGSRWQEKFDEPKIPNTR